MKYIKFLTAITFVLFLLSCGQSEQERKIAQKYHDDSIKQAAANLQRQKDATATNLKFYQQQLEQRIADLNVAQSEMKDIQDGHWYWTRDYQNQQIRQQTLKIENIQDNIKAIRGNIDKANAFLNQ